MSVLEEHVGSSSIMRATRNGAPWAGIAGVKVDGVLVKRTWAERDYSA